MFEPRAIVAALIITIGPSCTHLPVTTSRVHQPVQGLVTETDTRSRGRLLGSINGAEGRGIVELPSGDLLVAGEAESGFVERLTPDGSKKWLTPMPSAPATGVQVAAVDDDALYASFNGGSSSAGGPSVGSSLVRLDRTGRIAWRVDDHEPSPYIAPLAATNELVAVADRSHVSGVTPDGRVAWQASVEADPAKRALVRAIWIEAAVVIVLVDRDADSDLRALDATTGAPVWEIALRGDTFAYPLADPAHFSVSASGGVFAVRTAKSPHEAGWTITEFDPRTGAVGWQQWLDDRSANRPVLRSARREDVHTVLRLVLANDAYTASGDVFVGIDPASGHMLRFPDPELTGEIVNPSYLESSSFTLGRGRLLATGTFFGHLEWDGLDASSRHHRETVCTGDVGFPDTPCAWSHEASAAELTLFFARIPPD